MVTQGPESEPRHHVVIAGTGRAGTSFLVHFFSACGLDVGETDGEWLDRARAGLERNLLTGDAPYVVKDPWFFSYCQEIDSNRIAVDALVVPVRDLLSAATSRLLQEQIAAVEQSAPAGSPAGLRASVDAGIVYSTDPIDQARILAVGFHELIYWATASSIPLFLLAFPRSVEDADYLIGVLWPVLAPHCTAEAARAAFARTADPEAIRIRGAHPRPGAGGPALVHHRDASVLTNVNEAAGRILVAEQKARLAHVESQLVTTRLELAQERALVQELRRQIDRAHRSAAEMSSDRVSPPDRIAPRMASVKRLSQALRVRAGLRPSD